MCGVFTQWTIFSFLAGLLKTSEERNNCLKRLNCFMLGVGRKKILFSKTVSCCWLSEAVNQCSQTGRQGKLQVPLMSTLLSWHLSAQTTTFKLLPLMLSLSCSLCLHDLSRPPISIFFLILSFKCVFKLHKSHKSVSSLISHNRLFSLCFASFQPAVAAEKKTGRKRESKRAGGREVVCLHVCVKWALYSSPSSNKLSLEWAGNNPCGLVQSNCNPQHIITMAGSPLHCCSRAGAGGAHTHYRHSTHTHSLLSFATISTVLLAFSLTVLPLPGRPP